VSIPNESTESPPLYGEAAAIHSLYQAAFLEQDPPSSPRPRGRRWRWLAQSWRRVSASCSALGVSWGGPATSTP
jgi:hypothetical protein